ncbi:hypothetical protein AB1L30_17940 [Bremerella sp. JC817]|uniref:hypothetical protein n=1 Tax=Bremerella sp. JC817 TaxID=3231756 RepID=UPI003458D297
MLKKQSIITLAVWVGIERDQAPILEHQRIETPGGDSRLAGSLGLHMNMADVPREPGLYVIKASACVHQVPGHGWACRLIFEDAQRVTEGLTSLVKRWEAEAA